MSVKHQILSDLADRLKTITTANGYFLEVRNVYLDAAPLALDLPPYDLPAILILDGKDSPTHQQNWLFGRWNIHLQLIAPSGQSDEYMQRYCKTVMEAIYADAPGIRRNDQFKILGQATNWHIVHIEPDVNMIDANRFYEMIFEVQYHCHPTEI